MTAAQLPRNKNKNRFENIIPSEFIISQFLLKSHFSPWKMSILLTYVWSRGYIQHVGVGGCECVYVWVCVWGVCGWVGVCGCASMSVLVGLWVYGCVGRSVLVGVCVYGCASGCVGVGVGV